MKSAGQIPSVPKLRVLLLWSVIGWILVTLACVGLVQCGYGHWIELFNGATWPNLFVGPDASEVVGPPCSQFTAGGERGWLFFVVLGTRTFINLGVVLSAFSAVAGAYWLVSGGLEMIKTQLAAIGRARDLALAAQILRDLSLSGVQLGGEAEQMVLKTARGFHDSPMGQHFASMARKYGGESPEPAEHDQAR